ncbi:MAG: hypothetical protein KJ569_00570 [Candidatus Omnitrophica bacterium]|nr:hypothetical protein [Candidatus Omnitrophota bacterium]MBU1133386.1 hypothetical protein [Candidatus Omnitrophota bacterium]MBU1810606.1 hypothetical protein [Candidatus Omnitrophota bacterium]
MPKIALDVELDIEQIREAIEQLKPRQKIRLAQELEKGSLREHFWEVVQAIRKRAKSYPISQKQINRVCEKVRQRLYNERNRSSN